MLQLTVQLQRPLLPGFTVTYKHRPPAAHFYEQTLGLCQNEVPYFRRIRTFLNHLTCVKFCYCFYIRFLSFLARHCRSVWTLCPNPIFAISPVPVGIGTILPSMVILLECMFCYNWTDNTYQLVSPRKNTTRCKGSNFSISKSSSLLGFQVHIPLTSICTCTHTDLHTGVAWKAGLDPSDCETLDITESP